MLSTQYVERLPGGGCSQHGCVTCLQLCRHDIASFPVIVDDQHGDAVEILFVCVGSPNCVMLTRAHAIAGNDRKPYDKCRASSLTGTLCPDGAAMSGDQMFDN